MQLNIEKLVIFLKKNKSNIFFITALVFVYILTYHSNFTLSQNPLFDHYSYYYPSIEILHQSISEYGNFFPLWNIYKFGGSSYIGGIFPNIFSIIGIYILIAGNSIVALKVWEMSIILIGGLAMYFLVSYLLKKPSISFIAALIYMNNGFPLRYLNDGNLFTLTGYALMPFLVYSIIRSLRGKNVIMNSVVFGVVLSAFFWSSPDFKIFPFFMVFLGIYTLTYLLKFDKNSIKKIVLFYIIFSLVFAGLTLPKILPVKEGLENTWRAQFTYEQIRNSRRLLPDQLFSRLIEPIYEGMPKIRRDLTGSAHLGIIAFLLMVYGLYKKYKNRLVMTLGISALIAVLFATGTPVLYLFWKFVPGFSSFRYIERSLGLYVLCGTLLAAFGVYEILKNIKDKFRHNLVLFSIMLLIILNLIVFNFAAYPDDEWVTDLNKLNKENNMLKYISGEGGFFRYHAYETGGVGYTTEPFTVPNHIEQLYGYGSFWNIDYFNVFLAAAYQSPAKFWGIMNTKYVSAMQPINISGLRLIHTFDICTYCAPLDYVKIHGPYLYQNDEFMPRAYNIKKAILIVGDKETKTNLNYGVMLDNDFDPKNQIIIFGEDNLKKYGSEEISLFDSIILAQGSLQGTIEEETILKKFKEEGGKIYPDVLDGKNQITIEDVNEILTNDQSTYVPIPDFDIKRENFDKIRITLNKNITGWLVLSEKFSMFNGWEATSKDKKYEIYRTNGVISAIYLDSPVEEVVFEYKPKSWTVSKNIAITTIILLTLYFLYYFFTRRKNKKNEI